MSGLIMSRSRYLNSEFDLALAMQRTEDKYGMWMDSTFIENRNNEWSNCSHRQACSCHVGLRALKYEGYQMNIPI